MRNNKKLTYTINFIIEMGEPFINQDFFNIFSIDVQKLTRPNYIKYSRAIENMKMNL